jgi:hypothetical protein
MLGKLNVPSIHASKLGEEGLIKIANELVELQNEFELSFDYYFIHKRSFAVVTLFNAVFDAGINDAMKWDWYWTPMRFILIAVLDAVLDDETLKESWRLCLVPGARLPKEKENIQKLLTNVLSQLDSHAVGKRQLEVMRDALLFGIKNPLDMDFGIYSPTALSPNTIGFQFVTAAIAKRQKVGKQRALQITVDQQGQFNGAQKQTFEIQAKIAESFRNDPKGAKEYLEHPFQEGAREDSEILISHFPSEPITISNSKDSIGLQIADTYLWLTNRVLNRQWARRELSPLLDNVFRPGFVDGISIAAMVARWKAFERKLPDIESLTPEQMAITQSLVDRHRERVRALDLSID